MLADASFSDVNNTHNYTNLPQLSPSRNYAFLSLPFDTKYAFIYSLPFSTLFFVNAEDRTTWLAGDFAALDAGIKTRR